jgi:tetratricopeptide (TPR) repeat protein
LDYSIAILSGYAGIDALNGRGEAYAELGDYKKALHDFDQALTLNPNNTVAFVNRALVISLI